MAETAHSQTSRTPLFKRLIPLLVFIGILALFFALGGHRLLNFDVLARHYGALADWVAQQPVLASLAMVLVYATATAFSFPAAWILTVGAGLIFGWIWASALVVVGATTGACVLFLVARYALKSFFEQRAGGVVGRITKGFKQDASSYMLFLRLAPVFPFALVNTVPAIVGVPLLTFVWTTFVGIIPGVIAYTFAGEGLRSIIADRAEACAAGQPPCGTPISPGDLITPQILIALALLAMVSLVPVVLKRLRAASGKNKT